MLKHPTKYSTINLNELIKDSWMLTLNNWRNKGNFLFIKEKFHLSPSLQSIVGVENELNIVLVNLFNTSLASLKEKAFLLDYEPEIFVSTKDHADYSELIVKDNGKGISKELEKLIFQPSIKLDEDGTTLSPGLTLTYEIITQNHDGKISAHHLKSGGTKFKIKLPKTRDVY